MAKRKTHPEERAKIEASQELIRRALEGGLVADLETDKYRGKWNAATGERSREVARRFRGILADKEGVRVVCKARKWAMRGIWLELDVPDGRLVAGIGQHRDVEHLEY